MIHALIGGANRGIGHAVPPALNRTAIEFLELLGAEDEVRVE